MLARELVGERGAADDLVERGAHQSDRLAGSGPTRGSRRAARKPRRFHREPLRRRCRAQRILQPAAARTRQTASATPATTCETKRRRRGVSPCGRHRHRGLPVRRRQRRRVGGAVDDRIIRELTEHVEHTRAATRPQQGQPARRQLRREFAQCAEVGSSPPPRVPATGRTSPRTTSCARSMPPTQARRSQYRVRRAPRRASR